MKNNMSKKKERPPSLVIPEGHEIGMFYSSPFPMVEYGRSGMVIAHLGTAGEKQREDVELLFDDVKKILMEHSPQSKVLMANNTKSLSDLFAPNDPQLQPIQPSVVWTTTSGSLVEFTESAERVQHLLTLFQNIQISVPGTIQWLYIDDDNCSNLDVIVMLLTSIGIGIRIPDERRACLVEILRPEKVVLAALPGMPAKIAPYESFISLSQEKIEAMIQEDMKALQIIEQKEKEFLSQRIINVPLISENERVGLRAGKLRRLLLAMVKNQNNELWDDLCTAFLERKALFIMTGPNGEVSPRSWPGISAAIPIFIDFISLRVAANDTGVSFEDGQCGIAQMSISELCNWAMQIETEIVVNVFQDLATPFYLHLKKGVVQALAEGRIPTQQERELS